MPEPHSNSSPRSRGRKHKLRVRPCNSRGRGRPRDGRRDPERRYAVPGRLGPGRAAGARANCALLLHPIFKTRARQSRPSSGRCWARATRTGTTAGRRATSPSISPPPSGGRRIAISPRRCLTSSTACGWWWPTGNRCCAGAGSHPAPAKLAPPQRAGRRAARVRSLSCAGWRPATSPSWARASIGFAGEPRMAISCPRPKPASACCAIRPCMCCAAGRTGRHDAGDPPLLLRARAAHHHQGQRGQPRAPPRAHGLRRHQDLSRATARSPARFRIVGLFTSQAYARSPREIPFLRHKVETRAQGVRLSGRPAMRGKALINVLETFPRDELFQIEPRQLQEWSEGILDLETRPRVRVFARLDRFDRFVSLLVYVPRDRYSPSARERIGALLAEAYKGRIAAFYPYFTDGAAGARAVHRRPLRRRDARVDVAELERAISRDSAHLGRPAGRCHRSLGAACRHAAGEIPRGLPMRVTRKPSPPSARSKISPASSGSVPICLLPLTSIASPTRLRIASALPSTASADPINSVAARAAAREHGLCRHRRALLSRPARLCRRHARGHAARHGAGDRRRLADRTRRPRQAPGGRIPCRLPRARPTTTISTA